MKRRTHLLVSAAALLLLTFGWPSSAGAQQYQFGYLSYRQALQAMPEYTAAQQSLSALKTKYDDEAKYNEEKFRKMFADFLEGQKGFPQEIMLKRQKELQVAMEQGISFRKDAERLLSKAEDELMKPIVSKLDSTLALIGQLRGGRQYGICPVQKLLHRHVEAVHIVAPWLIDREPNPLDVI